MNAAASPGESAYDARVTRTVRPLVMFVSGQPDGGATSAAYP
jgi:hypothetical protein